MEAERDIIKRYIKTNLERKYIRPFYLLAAHRVIFTNKKNNSKPRFCVDFRKINNITIKDRYSLFKINKL